MLNVFVTNMWKKGDLKDPKEKQDKILDDILKKIEEEE